APLINSLGVALKLAYQDFDKKIEHIKELYEYLKEELLMHVRHTNINYKYGIPQILNVSFLDIDATTMHKELSKRHIYISTQTACNSDSSFSQTVKRITGSTRNAESSVRISLSHLTKKTELITLIEALQEILDENR
ncbi:MAG TPA: aminotransferase class V-fold PLP-dependent enzyme, partial [Bacillota bacterium]|nr:aminotransferase class V-fold PLP-dependent enzyme [Bacillota bacterium]